MTAPKLPTAPTPSPAPPRERLILQDMVQGMWISRMICSIAEFGVADALADGPKTARELAIATGTKEGPLRRVMRALVGEGVFGEDAQGRYELTPISEWLRSGPTTGRAAAINFGRPAVWAAWGQLSHALVTGGNPFEHVNGAPLFEFMKTHPEDARVFNEFMTSMPLFAGALLYDFAGAKRLVDVGGGHANGMIPVLRANPHLRGTLFELPQVAVGAREALAAAGLAERCEVAEGDFFESLPAGADVYLLSNIIHDWDDDDCGRILSNVRKAIPAHGRLLIVESIVPEGNEPSPAKMLDVQMLVMLGGVQRTEAELGALLAEAGFEIERVQQAGLPSLVVAAPR